MAETLDRVKLDTAEILAAAIDALLWSESDMESDDIIAEFLDDNYGPEDVSEELWEQLREDVTAFLDWQGDNLQAAARAGYLDGYGQGMIGHDFILTRNGHGAGFWDRGLGDIGDALSDAARSFGSLDAWAGADGKIYAE